MRIAIFYCDTPQGLLLQEAQLRATGSRVLYMTPNAMPESGNVTQQFVNPTLSPATVLDTFESKYILIVQV